MGFDPPTAREAGSGVNGCRFLGIPHGYTPGGASHARKHRTSAASALAISAVGAGETESNHVYCRISFAIMLFMHSAFRGEGGTIRNYEEFKSAVVHARHRCTLKHARIGSEFGRDVRGTSRDPRSLS